MIQKKKFGTDKTKSVNQGYVSKSFIYRNTTFYLIILRKKNNNFISSLKMIWNKKNEEVESWQTISLNNLNFKIKLGSTTFFWHAINLWNMSFYCSLYIFVKFITFFSSLLHFNGIRIPLNFKLCHPACKKINFLHANKRLLEKNMTCNFFSLTQISFFIIYYKIKICTI